MKKGIEKLENEADEQQKEINVLQKSLQRLRQVLRNKLSELNISGVDKPSHADSSVDKFISRLHHSIQENPKEHAELVGKIKGIISSIDYPK